MSIATTWHRGTATEITPGMSVQDQLDAAKLNWEVCLTPLQYHVELEGRDYGTFQNDSFQVAYRSDDGSILDVYKNRQPWQNRQIIESFNEFCENAEIQLTHLGYLPKGSIVYAAAKLPKTIAPSSSPEDQTEGYLILEDSHANGHGLQVWLYLNRLVCTNGMRQPVRQSQDVIDLLEGKVPTRDRRGNSSKERMQVIAHTGSFNPLRVKDILNSALRSLEVEQELAERFASTQIQVQEAALQLIEAFGDPSKPVEDQPRVVKTALTLFEGRAMGGDFLSAYNTVYGLLHAVTEYFNHHSNRGSKSDQFASILNGSRQQQMSKFQKQLVSCYIR